MNIKSMMLLTMLIALAACNASIPNPKKPSKSGRVPVNKTIPTELANITH